MDKTVLIVDDDKKIAELIAFRLGKQGYVTQCVYRGQDAIEYVYREKPVLVMLDIRLPDLDGVKVLQELRKNHRETYVIMISAHADVKLAVDCMKLGAYDFIEKPLELTELDTKVKRVLNQFRLEEEVSMLKRELGDKYKRKSIVGKSPGMTRVFQSIDFAAKSEASVLIEGESGTGKELVARAIHFNSAQKEAPFIAVNCGAIPEHLLESELFGHEKGAFTGAIARKIGKFEQAKGGTVFLDEVADFPPSLQVKLLRVLQEREIERIGGTQPIPIKVRFITATNRDLRQMIYEGTFRKDLYFRINVFPVRIPPLRERTEDIPELLRYFVNQHRESGNARVRIESSVLKQLLEYRWPGNVRELENVVERLMLIKGECDTITEEDVASLEMFHQADGMSHEPVRFSKDKVVGDAERLLIEQALRESGSNVTNASKLLQMSRDTLYRKMKKYAIEH